LFRLACVRACVCVCLCKQMFLIDRRLLIRSVFLWLGTAFHFYLTHTHTHTLFTLIISVCLIGWGKFSVCVCEDLISVLESVFLSCTSCDCYVRVCVENCVCKHSTHWWLLVSTSHNNSVERVSYVRSIFSLMRLQLFDQK